MRRGACPKAAGLVGRQVVSGQCVRALWGPTALLQEGDVREGPGAMGYSRGDMIRTRCCLLVRERKLHLYWGLDSQNLNIKSKENETSVVSS